MIKGLEAVLSSLLLVSVSGCSPHVVDSGSGGAAVEASCAVTACATTTCETGTTCGTTCCVTTVSGCCTTTCSGCCTLTTIETTCCSTPLVLSFDGAPVGFVADDAHGFALSADESIKTDWPTAATPWLALDRDGDGAIRDGGELFGSATALEGGGLARNGFEALAELDRNHDGRIDASDPAFAKLVLWRDRNGDRKSSPEELEPAERTLIAIDLHDRRDVRCDARGNCEVERATFSYRTEAGDVREGAIIDVHLRHRR